MNRISFEQLHPAWAVDWSHLEAIDPAIVPGKTRVALIHGGFGEFQDLDRVTGVGFDHNLAIAEAAGMPVVVWVVLRPPICREFAPGVYRMETLAEAGAYQAECWLEYVQGHPLIKAIGPDWEDECVAATVVRSFLETLERGFDRAHIWTYTRVTFVNEYCKPAWVWLLKYRLWLAQTWGGYQVTDCSWEEAKATIQTHWFPPDLPPGGSEDCWIANQACIDRLGLPGVMSPTLPGKRARSDITIIRGDMIEDFFEQPKPDPGPDPKHNLYFPIVTSQAAIGGKGAGAQDFTHPEA
jgi:hypothetical protein